MPKEKRPRTIRRELASRGTPTAGEIEGKYSSVAALVDGHLPGVFLALALLIGTLYAFVMPPMQIPDEIMHFARVYSVSQGVCIASPDIDVPKSFAQLNDLFPPWLERHRQISLADLRIALKLPLNDHDMAGNGRERSLDGFINQNVYHCVAYLPEAMVLNVGRRAALSPLVLMYLCRLTNLACYALLTFLALRLLPDFKIILFCVALMPMALHQAASVSADSTYIAVSFLFAAYVFQLAFAKEAGKLGIGRFLILAALTAFLALTKTAIYMVFLLFLIPGETFPSRRSRWLAIAAFFLLAIGSAAVWQHVNEPNMQRVAEERAARGIDMAGDWRFVREHPLELALIFVSCMTDQAYLYRNLKGFVGVLGWLSVPLPDWLVWIYFVLLITAAATQTRAATFTLPLRGIVLVFLAAAVGTTLAGGWVLETPKFILSRPGVWGNIRISIQGRYWIPFAFPMLVLFSTGRTRFNPRYFAVIAAGVVVLASAVALSMVYSTYYI